MSSRFGNHQSSSGDADSTTPAQDLAPLLVTPHIGCEASDLISGLTFSRCPELEALAGEYGVGQHILTGTAEDLAGNTTTQMFSFTVEVDSDSLGRLVELYLGERRNRGVVRSLQVKLEAGAYDDFIAQVDALCCTPRSGKLFTEAEAATLTTLAETAKLQ